MSGITAFSWCCYRTPLESGGDAMQGTSATNLPSARPIVGPSERLPSASSRRTRAILTATCWVLIAPIFATDSIAEDAGDLRLASAVFHLNGVRIHSSNCGKQPNDDLELQLATALGITQTKRRMALHEYVDTIYAYMISTAAKECMPEMLDAYSQGFREKLDELVKMRRD